jgi:hypothetical protein
MALVDPDEIISIHAPHAGSDVVVSWKHSAKSISIHAPHAGSDRYILYFNDSYTATY